MMKVKLLNGGGYESFADVAFPIEVDVSVFYGGGVHVDFYIANKFEGFNFSLDDTDYGSGFFFANHEFEVVDE